MYFPFKQHIKKAFPTTFQKLRSIKDQVVIEAKTLRQVGVSRILKQFVSSSQKWKTELPVQKTRRVKMTARSLDALKKENINFKKGGHTIYFPPAAVLKTSLQCVTKYMPENVGVKIVSRMGNIDVPYSDSQKTCLSHTYMSPSHDELILVHAMFASLGLGPRLYDLVELEFENEDIHVAYVIEHVDGDACANKQKCEDFIQKFKTLEKSKLIKLINWNGYYDMDFECPACNDNLILEKSSKQLKYVDLQNFGLDNYYDYLKKTAVEASKDSHFGQKSYLMGGEYLYQEIPGLNLSAKRSPSVRFDAFKNLLNKNGLSLKDKFILDIGCNMGLMGAQYLKEGAAWLHGFDMPNVVSSTEKVLLAIGCTRFSTTGVMLTDEISLTQHLPSNLKNKLDSCVISYLAIRGHIGWVKELGEIPWDFMLYEGHEKEDALMSKNFIQELQQIKDCYVFEEAWISDANSAPRYIAIIKSGSFQ